MQSQSITVDRQMRSGYAVPRIAFINKMDRTGANPQNVIQQLESKLGLTTVPLQIPIGLESNFQGVIDLIDREAVYYDGDKGENVRLEPIPAELVDAAERARQGMLEALSMLSDEIMSLLLEESEVPIDLIHKTIRDGTIAQQICPVMIGTAYLEQARACSRCSTPWAGTRPARSTARLFAKDNGNGGAELASGRPIPDRPAGRHGGVKLVEEPFGQVTFVRSYQGTLRKGTFSYYNTRRRQRKRARISRILPRAR